MTGPILEHARALAGGAAASTMVIVAGTVLGTARVLVVAPWAGDVAATLLELPLILAAGWFACAAAARSCRVASGTGPRLAMGAAALVVLLALEALLSFSVAGTPPSVWLDRFAEPAARIGLAAQVVYAAFPLLQARLTRPPR